MYTERNPLVSWQFRIRFQQKTEREIPSIHSKLKRPFNNIATGLGKVPVFTSYTWNYGTPIIRVIIHPLPDFSYRPFISAPKSHVTSCHSQIGIIGSKRVPFWALGGRHWDTSPAPQSERFDRRPTLARIKQPLEDNPLRTYPRQIRRLNAKEKYYSPFAFSCKNYSIMICSMSSMLLRIE